MLVDLLILFNVWIIKYGFISVLLGITVFTCRHMYKGSSLRELMFFIPWATVQLIIPLLSLIGFNTTVHYVYLMLYGVP